MENWHPWLGEMYIKVSTLRSGSVLLRRSVKQIRSTSQHRDGQEGFEVGNEKSLFGQQEAPLV